jgi:hypothetical protein
VCVCVLCIVNNVVEGMSINVTSINRKKFFVSVMKAERKEGGKGGCRKGGKEEEDITT